MFCAFRTRSFSRWAKKTRLSDEALRKAIFEMRQGLIDADLGGHVMKKRVALSGHGKRSGARTIVASKTAGRWFFIYGFSKSERSNIDEDELRALQELARTLVGLDDRQLAAALEAGELVEIGGGNGET